MLDREQLELICRTIPKTHVQVLQLEWNVSREHTNTDDATAAPPVLTPAAPHDSHAVEDVKSSVLEKATLGCDDDSVVFAQLLVASSPLVVLSLRANGMTAGGATALAHALRANTTLQSLNLFQNCVGDDGALAIAHALPYNTALKVLSLANNGLTGVGCVRERGRADRLLLGWSLLTTRLNQLCVLLAEQKCSLVRSQGTWRHQHCSKRSRTRRARFTPR